MGIASLFVPQWRIAAAFQGELFVEIAGVNPIIKGAAGTNKRIALVLDIFIFLGLLAYVISCR